MAFNFPEKYKESLVEGFNVASETNGLFTTELDEQFSGVRTVHVAQLNPVPLQKYNRNKQVGTGSRYGVTTEVEDNLMTFEMMEDVSFSASIDKGNEKEQLNWKSAGAFMNVQKKKVIVPYVDKYSLKKWAEKGTHFMLPATLTKTNIVETIIKAHNEQMEHGVPEGVILCIARKHIPDLKLAPEWVGLDSLGGETLPKGTIAKFDGMYVRPFTTRNMPENVPFFLLDKSSVIRPMKIKDMKVHHDPQGLSGDLLEFRMLFDAFVLGYRAEGVWVAIDKGKMVTAPTINGNSTTVTINGATGGSPSYHYTTDGSDPRYSKTVQTGSSISSVAVGTIVKAYASSDGLYDSPVVEKEITE